MSYFNDCVACAKAGSGRCVDNPYYSSVYAARRSRPDRSASVIADIPPSGPNLIQIDSVNVNEREVRPWS